MLCSSGVLPTFSHLPLEKLESSCFTPTEDTATILSIALISIIDNIDRSQQHRRIVLIFLFVFGGVSKLVRRIIADKGA